MTPVAGFFLCLAIAAVIVAVCVAGALIVDPATRLVMRAVYAVVAWLDETSRRRIDVHTARARDMPWSLTDEPARGTEAQR